jgi:hypothetical protein
MIPQWIDIHATTDRSLRKMKQWILCPPQIPDLFVLSFALLSPVRELLASASSFSFLNSLRWKSCTLAVGGDFFLSLFFLFAPRMLVWLPFRYAKSWKPIPLRWVSCEKNVQIHVFVRHKFAMTLEIIVQNHE